MPKRKPQKGPGRPLRGWIIAFEDEREELEQMGIKLGLYNEDMVRFERCVVPHSALHLLVAQGDRFKRSLK